MNKARGAALVELALVLPVVLMMVFGITELGRALFQLNSLAKAADGGVRYLSRSWAVLDENCQPTAGWSAAAAATANYVVFGNSGGQGQPRLPGLSAAGVTVTAVYGEVAGSEDPACIIQVEASVPFQGVFGDNVVPFTQLGPIDLTTRREARYIGE
jgi:Flp pilus assembly protein TadG